MPSITLSTAIWSSVKPVLKIYLIIFTGFILARKNILGVKTSRNLSDLVVNVALPALMFNKIVSNLSYEDGKSIGVLSFACFLVLTIGGLTGALLNYVTPNPRKFYYGMIVAAMFPNMGDLPIAFIQGMPPVIFSPTQVDKGIAYAAIFSLFEMITFFSAGFVEMIGFDFKDEGKKDDEKEDEEIEDENTVRPETLTTSASRRVAEVVNEYSEENREGQESVLDELSLVRSKSRRSELKAGSDTKSKVLTKLKDAFWVVVFSFKRPAATSILIAIIVALIPWTKALFSPYHRHVNYPNAPDGTPPLHFIIDICTYIGNSEVPLGLLVLGGTLGRLELKSITKELAFTAFVLAIVKLAVIPIVGVALMTKFARLGWFNDDMGTFLSVVNWGLPTMTTQIYITAFFTPVSGPHVQMDCIAVYLSMQYVVLVISFPILITYCMKSTLGY